MDILTSFTLACHIHTGEWLKDGIHTVPGKTNYRFTRISPSTLRSTETPAVMACVRHAFGVWHIQPAKGIFYRVELV